MVPEIQLEVGHRRIRVREIGAVTHEVQRGGDVGGLVGRVRAAPVGVGVVADLIGVVLERDLQVPRGALIRLGVGPRGGIRVVVTADTVRRGGSAVARTGARLGEVEPRLGRSRTAVVTDDPDRDADRQALAGLQRRTRGDAHGDSASARRCWRQGERSARHAGHLGARRDVWTGDGVTNGDGRGEVLSRLQGRRGRAVHRKADHLEVRAEVGQVAPVHDLGQTSAGGVDVGGIVLAPEPVRHAAGCTQS